MEIQEIASLGHFADAWDELVDAMPLPTPFLRSWWLANVANGEPYFLVVVAEGELVGGLALQRTSRAGVEWLEFLGAGALEPDHLDIVCRRDSVAEVCTLLRQHLGRRGNRVIDLVGARAAGHVLDVVPGRGRVTSLDAAPYVDLPSTPEEYLGSRPGRMRSTITRTTKRLTKTGVEFRAVDNEPTAVDVALETLNQLHDGRWGDQSGFLSQWDNFCAAARAGCAAGEMRFNELVDADGDVIATEVDFVVGDRTSFYQAGRKTDHELRGSGSMLRFEIIRRAIEAGGSEFDLLRGVEDYKAEWATGRRGLVRIRRGVGPRGTAIVAAAEANVAVQDWRATRSVHSSDRAAGQAPAGDKPSASVVFYSDAAQLGGAESVAKNLLRELDERFAVTVVGTTQLVVDDIAAVRPSASTKLLPPINDRSDVGAMIAHRREFASMRPDIFHANLGEGSACQYALLAALSVPGVRVVVTENSPMGVRSELSRRIKRMSAPRFAAHVAVGERAARMVEADVGLPYGAVEHIFNGVPVIDYPPSEPRDDGFVIGAMARFDPVKGLDVLIRAVAQVPEVRLEIVGDGPERSNLETLIAELGLGTRVLLRGWISDARKVLPDFDLVVLPSRLEGMPMVLIEAMQAGVMTLATDVGSVREVVEDGVTGGVVPPDDVDALAAAIKDLVEDAAGRARIAAAGRERALALFTSAANVAAYEALYDRVLNNS